MQRDFDAVYTHGKTVKRPSCVFTWAPNTLQFSRFGVVAGKRVGAAVVRALVKRRIRAIAQEIKDSLIKPSDIIISARPLAARREFDELRRDIWEAARAAGLLKQ